MSNRQRIGIFSKSTGDMLGAFKLCRLIDERDRKVQLIEGIDEKLDRALKMKRYLEQIGYKRIQEVYGFETITFARAMAVEPNARKGGIGQMINQFSLQYSRKEMGSTHMVAWIWSPETIHIAKT